MHLLVLARWLAHVMLSSLRGVPKDFERDFNCAHIGCVRKNYKIFVKFIAKKINKAQQQPSGGQKHNFLVCKMLFKWYQSMIGCKSYGPLSDKW